MFMNFVSLTIIIGIAISYMIYDSRRRDKHMQELIKKYKDDAQK